MTSEKAKHRLTVKSVPVCLPIAVCNVLIISFLHSARRSELQKQLVEISIPCRGTSTQPQFGTFEAFEWPVGRIQQTQCEYLAGLGALQL